MSDFTNFHIPGITIPQHMLGAYGVEIRLHADYEAISVDPPKLQQPPVDGCYTEQKLKKDSVASLLGAHCMQMDSYTWHPQIVLLILSLHNHVFSETLHNLMIIKETGTDASEDDRWSVALIIPIDGGWEVYKIPLEGHAHMMSRAILEIGRKYRLILPRRLG